MQWATSGADCPTACSAAIRRRARSTPHQVSPRARRVAFFFHAFLRTLITNVFADDLAVAAKTSMTCRPRGLFFLLCSREHRRRRSGLELLQRRRRDRRAGRRTLRRTGRQRAARRIPGLDQRARCVEQLGLGARHTMQPVSLSPLVTTSYAPGPFARAGSVTGRRRHAFPSTLRPISRFAPARTFATSRMDSGDAGSSKCSYRPGTRRARSRCRPDLLAVVTEQLFNLAFGDQIDSAAVSTQSFTAP